MEVRVELNGRRKEIAENAANCKARGEACSDSASVDPAEVRVWMARGDASIDIVKTVRTWSMLGLEDKVQ